MRDSRTRSFSAVGMQGSSLAAKRNKKRNALIAALVVVGLLIVLFTVLIFGELFGWVEQKAPDLPADDVGGIKLEYEEKLVSTSDAHQGDLILINSSFPYTFPETTDNYLAFYENRNVLGSFPSGNPIYAYYPETWANCAQFESKTLAALNAWTEDFYRATEEVNLFIYDADGYRTGEKQTELNTSNPQKYSPSGETEHHTGKAVDFYYKKDKNDPVLKIDDPAHAGTYSWLYKNAHKYGFIHRYPAEKADITGVANEPYHFRYVGVAHATYMYQNDLCLEEYLDLLRDNYNYGEKHLEFVGEDGTQYVVYYVKASSDSMTVIHVPKADDKTSYEISGDNKEGFIVTVTITK